MINALQLNEDQLQVINSPVNSRIFLEGIPGSGKTTTAIYRMFEQSVRGIDPGSILILLPQRSLAHPYHSFLDGGAIPPGSQPHIFTLAGLGQQVIRLFWPLLVEKAGFQKHEPPFFLSIETSQYYLDKLVQPMIERGHFETISLDKNRLLSQILDNLNKSAFVGFPSTEISVRLKDAWLGDVSQTRVYEDTQTAANLFREFCLANNLVDFSLNISIFCHIAWQIRECREYLISKYRHLIYDNVEEDTPSAHDLILDWLPNLESALVIMDEGGGYRTFLGSDPLSAKRFKDQMDTYVRTTTSFYGEGRTIKLADAFKQAINRKKVQTRASDLAGMMEFSNQPYPTEMVRWVTDRVETMVVDNGIPPGEIVIIAPYLSDSLRFSITHALEQKNLPVQSHRPSRRLSAEPATLCLLTLAQLAHPHWNHPPNRFEVRNAFLQSFAGMDLIRADLMSRIVYSLRKTDFSLNPFGIIQPSMQERITFRIGEKYEILRSWLYTYQNNSPVELDIFLSRLFGEVLSQPGFGFHQNYQGAATVSRLISSAADFRNLPALPDKKHVDDISGEFINLFHEGIIGTQYLNRENQWNKEAVFIAPAYTFLMLNRPVGFQFWLDVSSMGWWERINQPLTHPIVLSRNWNEGGKWTDVEEYAFNQMTLQRVISGLLYRCTEKVFLCAAGMNQTGDEERGPLLKAVQRINLAMIQDNYGAG